ncbi:porin [Parashewanella spongiae]|uniref:Porin n=1 Tax=Parashewanella spongiae TaxID=342950 RepID=A0A3A6TRV0_9GAMM|nr:porin [Parashewanella spongiae]MCL1077819.1 porin [Parashewanella spongiae]RJY18882.1 porin [Parashewanella spongiae]
MKVSILATTLATILVAPSISAMPIYSDHINSVTGYGALGVSVINTNDQTELVNGGSSVGLNFSHKLESGWDVIGQFEWGVNPVGESKIVFNSDSLVEQLDGDFFYNRIGYVGFKHDKYGTVTFGKQWGAWFDVVKDTDYGAVWDGNAAGVNTFLSDGGINGVGRSEQTIQYRNVYDNLSIALQMQIKKDSFDINENNGNSPFPQMGTRNQQKIVIDNDGRMSEVEYGNTYGVSMRYIINPDFTITAGYNRGEFDVNHVNGGQTSEIDDIYGAGIVYGKWKHVGLYAAANYSQSHYHDTDNIGRILPESEGVEAVVSYLFKNDIRAYVQYDVLNAGTEYQKAYSGDNFLRENVIASLQFQWDPQTLIYLEERFDFSDFNGAHKSAMEPYDDGGIAVGLKYKF